MLIERLVQPHFRHQLRVALGGDTAFPAMMVTGSPGIIWTNAKVSNVMPINVGITNPKRRSMNCNISRTLCINARQLIVRQAY